MAKETKESILRAAAELFGERGFDNVSVREITKRANVNLSALSYHFTDKAGLIDEVIIVSVTNLNKNRQSLLAKAKMDNDGTPSLREVIEAFIAPVFLPEIHKTQPKIIAALAAKTFVTSEENNPYNNEAFKETAQLFRQTFAEVCPQLSNDDIRYLMKMISGTAVTFRAFAYNDDGINEIKATADVYENEFKLLLDFCEGGFQRALEEKVK